MPSASRPTIQKGNFIFLDYKRNLKTGLKCKREQCGKVFDQSSVNQTCCSVRCTRLKNSGK